jgi:hypothetical protein
METFFSYAIETVVICCIFSQWPGFHEESWRLYSHDFYGYVSHRSYISQLKPIYSCVTNIHFSILNCSEKQKTNPLQLEHNTKVSK